jgi:hypothetical protein
MEDPVFEQEAGVAHSGDVRVDGRVPLAVAVKPSFSRRKHEWPSQVPGLSMDYEVYTVSRMQEEWRRLRSRPGNATWRNHAAVTAGQANSTRIVTAAAGIMILVFGSFLRADPAESIGTGGAREPAGRSG